MRAALLLLVLCGCTDLIGPMDPAYEEECVFYIAEGEAAQIPIDVLERCESIEVRVAKFPGADR